MKSCKLLLAALGATLLLASLVGSASARSFSTSSQTLRRTFRTVTFGGAFGSIRCGLTLEGSLHSRTIAKVVGSLIGYITSVTIGVCETGSVTVLSATLPWHMTYAGFTGTLPNITGIRENVIGVSLQIREPLFTCLLRSTTANPVVLTFNREAGGALTTATLGGTVPTSCGVNGSFSSSADPVTVLNSAARITVTLI